MLSLRLSLVLALASAARIDEDLTNAAALLAHGSERSREEAAKHIFLLAVGSTGRGGDPIAFRVRCVAEGIIQELIKLLDSRGESEATRWSLAALASIATDDPTSEADNDHALAVCSAGVVPPLVRMLSSANREVQLSAAGCAATLAEDPHCQRLLLAEGAVGQLVRLATFGSSAAHSGVKVTAVSALEQLAHNADGRDAILAAGGRELLESVAAFAGGDEQLQQLSSAFAEDLREREKVRVSLDSKSRVRKAHATRLKYSKIWDAAGIHRAYAPQG